MAAEKQGSTERKGEQHAGPLRSPKKREKVLRH